MLNQKALLIVIIVQMLTESLPISSSGHVTLVCMAISTLFALPYHVLPDHIDHLLHGPTSIIVALAFFRVWFPLLPQTALSVLLMLKGACGRAVMPASRRRFMLIIGSLLRFIISANTITAVCYCAKKYITTHTTTMQSPYMLLVGFGITSLLLFSKSVVSKIWSIRCFVTSLATITSRDHKLQQFCYRDSFASKLSVSNACLFGLVQGLALVPGISRFASTVIIGRWLGFSTRRSLQLSFATFFPLMVAAFVVQGVASSDGRKFLATTCSELYFLMTILATSVLAYFLFIKALRDFENGQEWRYGFYMLLPLTLLTLLLCTAPFS